MEHDDFVASLIRYLDGKGIQARIVEPNKAGRYIEQSELTKLWYVREADGTVLLDRETKAGAEASTATVK